MSQALKTATAGVLMLLMSTSVFAQAPASTGTFEDFIQTVKRTKIAVNNAYAVLPQKLSGSTTSAEFAALSEPVFADILSSTRFYAVEGLCRSNATDRKVVTSMPNGDLCFSFSNYQNNTDKDLKRHLLISALMEFSTQLGFESPTRDFFAKELEAGWDDFQAELQSPKNLGPFMSLSTGSVNGSNHHDFKVFEKVGETWADMAVYIYGSYLKVAAMKLGEGTASHSSALMSPLMVTEDHIERILEKTEVIVQEQACPGTKERYNVTILSPTLICLSYQDFKDLSDDHFAFQVHSSMTYALGRMMGMSPGAARVLTAEYHSGDSRYIKVELLLQTVTEELLQQLEKQLKEESPKSRNGRDI